MSTQAQAKGYNGWTNYETWAVALWLDNDEGSYERARELAREARDESAGMGVSPYKRTPEGLLADQFKDWVQEESPDLGASLYSDLLSAALSEVDWYEIAEHYLADLPDEDESE
jgi:hypothetical protein